MALLTLELALVRVRNEGGGLVYGYLAVASSILVANPEPPDHGVGDGDQEVS